MFRILNIYDVGYIIQFGCTQSRKRRKTAKKRYLLPFSFSTKVSEYYSIKKERSSTKKKDFHVTSNVI